MIAIPLGEHLLHENGNPIPPVTALTWLQVVAGTAALLAVAAVLGLAVGTLLRRSAGAVTAVIVGIVLPYLLAVPGILPVGAEQWLVRVTPAAAFAVQQSTHAVPPGHRRLYAGQRVLPAGAVGRVRGAVRLGRRRPGPRAVPAPPEGRVSDVVHAEWTKLRTLPGPGWLLLAAAALTAAVGAIAANAVTCPAGSSCQIDPAKVSLTGIDLGQAIVAIVAVTVISGEYSTGMIRLTLTATPRRWRVLAAKGAVVGAATLVTGAVAVLASVLAGGAAAGPARPHRGARLRGRCRWATGPCCAPPPGRCCTSG